MNKRTATALLLLLSFIIKGLGQQAAPPAQQPPPKQQSTPKTQTREDVVRISTNLVQVDVSVTDHQGQPVTDLKADDFDVAEDGRPQKITNLSFITPASVQPPPAAAASAKPARGVAPAPPPPPVHLRPEQVRRTIALVVDDLGLSFESSHYVRAALRKFVDEQMHPGDLVAIIRTGAGIGALQQFTADRGLLYAAIERVRYNLNSRNFSAFAPVGNDIRTTDSRGSSVNGMNGRDSSTSNFRNMDDTHDSQYNPGNELINSLLRVATPGAQSNQYRDDIFSVGTLGALNYIIRGLRTLPGRKSVVLFSDGFRMYDEDQGSRRLLDSMERLVDLANRASVVIYTIDPRGVQVLGVTAADNFAGPFAVGNGNMDAGNGDPLQEQWVMGMDTDLQTRRNDYFATQQGLSYLAKQTGGMFVKNNNDIEGALRRVLNDQNGYYLLGYRPDESTFNQEGRRASFHHIAVKVKRPGLIVRTRTGFYSFTSEEALHPAYQNVPQQLYAALASPFNSGDINVRMSSVFGFDPERGGSFTESILHINGQDLTFTKQPDGTHKASFEILSVTFGDNGSVVDQGARAYSIVVQEADLEHTRNSGLIYVVTLPIKKPGAYQLRMAIRDSTSGNVGSANQFIEVPDIKKKRLTLSGVILNRSVSQPTVTSTVSNSSSNGAANSASAAAGTSASAGTEISATEGQVQEGHPLASQAIRQFHHGQALGYGYYIYNARLNSAHRPQLETQMRLYRDGQLVYTGQVHQLDTTGQTDMRQIEAGGALRLGTDLKPGEYVLQVIVVDKLASGDTSLATQWMDFDLVD